MRFWAPALALGGCAQIAGIDKTTGIDPHDTLALRRDSVGATVVSNPFDLTALTASYLVADDTQPGGFDRLTPDVGDPGTWVTKVPGEPQMLFTLPDQPTPYYRLFDLGRDITAAYPILEHANPSLPPPAATVTTDVTLASPTAGGEVFEFAVIGAWVARTYAAAELPAVGGTQLTVTFPYGSTASTTGSPTLNAITTDDAMLVLEYVGGVLTGASDSPGVAQADATTVTTPMAAVPTDQTIAVPVDQAALAARLAAGQPTVGAPTITWTMTAAPGGASGSSAGPVLASGTLAAVDTMIASNYGNPFATARSWPATFSVSATATRMYTPPSQGLPVQLDATLFEVSAPGALSGTLPAPLPIGIAIGGTTIVTDGVDLHVDPTVPVTVSLTTDLATATLYQVELDELVPNMGNTTLVKVPRLDATSRTPTFTLPSELFMNGHIYTLRAKCLQDGYPDVADGDFATRSLPASAGAFDSGVFTVVPP